LLDNFHLDLLVFFHYLILQKYHTDFVIIPSITVLDPSFVDTAVVEKGTNPLVEIFDKVF